MEKLISVVFDNSEHSANASLLKDLGHCIASIIVDDFATRIFPATAQDNESLEESIASPFFILCRCAFSDNRSSWASTPMSLLASISRFFEAACFLVLYFLRGMFLISTAYCSRVHPTWLSSNSLSHHRLIESFSLINPPDS